MRARKHLRMRQTILENAVRLFLIDGYSNTTLKNIADAAETSITTILRYFSSKDEILLYKDRAVVAELSNRISGRVYKTLSEGVRDAVEMSVIDFDDRAPLFGAILMDPACVSLQAAIRHEWETLLEGLFLQFSPQTKAGCLRAKSLAYMLVASGMAGLQYWHEDGRKVSVQDLQPDLIEEFISAFVRPIEKNYAAQSTSELIAFDPLPSS